MEGGREGAGGGVSVSGKRVEGGRPSSSEDQPSWLWSNKEGERVTSVGWLSERTRAEGGRKDASKPDGRCSLGPNSGLLGPERRTGDGPEPSQTPCMRSIGSRCIFGLGAGSHTRQEVRPGRTEACAGMRGRRAWGG